MQRMMGMTNRMMMPTETNRNRLTIPSLHTLAPSVVPQA